MQQKVRSYVSGKRRVTDGNGNLPPKSEMKTIKVPIPTFPPTAMVYSVNKITAGTKSQKQDWFKNKVCFLSISYVNQYVRYLLLASVREVLRVGI